MKTFVKLDMPLQWMSEMAFSGNGKRLITSFGKSCIDVWDTATGENLFGYLPTPVSYVAPIFFGSDYKMYVECVALDHTGEYAVIGCNDCTVRLISVDQQGEILVIKQDKYSEADDGFGRVRYVAFSPDSNLIYAGFENRVVGIWNIKKDDWKFLSQAQDIYNHAPSHIFGNCVGYINIIGNQYVFAAFLDGTVTLWDLETSEIVFEGFDYLQEHHPELIPDDTRNELGLRFVEYGVNIPSSDKPLPIRYWQNDDLHIFHAYTTIVRRKSHYALNPNNHCIGLQIDTGVALISLENEPKIKTEFPAPQQVRGTAVFGNTLYVAISKYLHNKRKPENAIITFEIR